MINPDPSARHVPSGGWGGDAGSLPLHVGPEGFHVSSVPRELADEASVQGVDSMGSDHPGAALNAEMNAAAERFAALSSDEQRAWLEANLDALRAGDLTLEDLP